MGEPLNAVPDIVSARAVGTLRRSGVGFLHVMLQALERLRLGPGEALDVVDPLEVADADAAAVGEDVGDDEEEEWEEEDDEEEDAGDEEDDDEEGREEEKYDEDEEEWD